jgi:hypothetical protein
MAAPSQWGANGSASIVTRALQTALICKQIAAEKLAVWNGDLKLNHSAIRARPNGARRAEGAVLG